MKQLRRKSKLLRTEVSEILGIDVSTLNRLENGKLPMKKLIAEKLAELYQVSPDVIYSKWRGKCNDNKWYRNKRCDWRNKAIIFRKDSFEK